MGLLIFSCAHRLTNQAHLRNGDEKTPPRGEVIRVLAENPRHFRANFSAQLAVVPSLKLPGLFCVLRCTRGEEPPVVRMLENVPTSVVALSGRTFERLLAIDGKRDKLRNELLIPVAFLPGSIDCEMCHEIPFCWRKILVLQNEVGTKYDFRQLSAECFF